MSDTPHYAFQAASLLEEALVNLQQVIDKNEDEMRSHTVLYDLKDTLMLTETFLYQHFRSLLEREQTRLPSLKTKILCKNSHPGSLEACANLLRLVLEEARDSTSGNRDEKTGKTHFSGRNALDSLLFRLTVILQLTIVRIGDIRFIIVGGNASLYGWIGSAGAASMAGVSATMLSRTRNRADSGSMSLWLSGANASLGLLSAFWIRRAVQSMWARNKVNSCVRDLEEWNEQWATLGSNSIMRHRETTEESNPLDVSRLQKFIQYSMRESQKSPIWHSTGEMRFLMLKRAMDVFYASVGTANQWMHYTGAPRGEKDTANWQLTLASAAAASFYSLIGANSKASVVTSSSESARDLLQSAWGLVSLPSIKTLSLQASRLIKGAGVADRVEIAGVPCFVLSKDPAPELAAAIRRCQRRFGHSAPAKSLSTIDEVAEHMPDSPTRERKPFARSCGRFRQRDVIFHLTGGGFFAHIIASDLPYLLDWSAATGAVIICPEYALLPEHTFPDALSEVEDVYLSLLCEDTVRSLGFEVNRIVVTGESAGGNLAAALCVKLSMEQEITNPHETTDEEWPMQTTKLPDALMLSCAVLNLSLDLTVSRVMGTDDPVLPSGLISAISDAYLPKELGVSRNDPLASPIYATDTTLARFPPTLLFASSNDPLLDDSVMFNKRLRDVGVDSELRAVPNLPHAYLGLGTTGFPEAKQVQQECQAWLAEKLS